MFSIDSSHNSGITGGKADFQANFSQAAQASAKRNVARKHRKSFNFKAEEDGKTFGQPVTHRRKELPRQKQYKSI